MANDREQVRTMEIIRASQIIFVGFLKAGRQMPEHFRKTQFLPGVVPRFEGQRGKRKAPGKFQMQRWVLNKWWKVTRHSHNLGI